MNYEHFVKIIESLSDTGYHQYTNRHPFHKPNILQIIKSKNKHFNSILINRVGPLYQEQRELCSTKKSVEI